MRECLVKKVPVNLSVYVITSGGAPTDGNRNQRTASETVTKTVARPFKDKAILDEENSFPVRSLTLSLSLCPRHCTEYSVSKTICDNFSFLD